MDSALLTHEALKLSPGERAQLAEALWQSLDSPDQRSIDEAWAKVSWERLQAYHAGKMAAYESDLVFAEIANESKA